MNLNSLVASLRRAFDDVAGQLEQLEEYVGSGSTFKASQNALRRKAKGESPDGSESPNGKKKRVVSDEARAKIGAAQKKRWAKVHAEKDKEAKKA